jgi:hypothetical protein
LKGERFLNVALVAHAAPWHNSDTSAASERGFSKASDIIIKKRNCLELTTAEIVLFLIENEFI